MVVREIVVVKKPRDDPLQDKPISFPDLENLHLDMMENKKKLKKNLPLIVIKPSATSEKPSDKKANIYPQAIISGVLGAASGAVLASEKKASKENFVSEKKKGKKVPEVKIKEEKEELEEEEGELLENLGAEEEEEKEEEEKEEEEKEEEEKEEVEGESAPEETKEVEEDDPYAGLSPEERERQEKEEYIWRFKILKKKYKSRKDISDYNEHDDLFTMKQTYERTLREIQLEDNCESYRMYLIGGFMLMEFVSNNWMGVDLTGFTAQQMTMMHKYDRMLIELGEKSYNRWGSNLPVEIRLIGFIILQAGIFYLGKIIAEKGGGTMTEIFKMFTGTTPVAAPSSENSEQPREQESAPKKKMRGPSVKVADLRKKAEE